MLDTRHIADVMEEYVSSEDIGGWGELSYEHEIGASFEVPRLGTVTLVDVETSGEGGGEHTHVVFSVTMVDSSVRLFQKTGAYMSHYGNDWDGPILQVRAVEKVITDFVRA